MKTRIVNIENMIKKAFEKYQGFDSVIAVLGRYKEDEDKSNYICMFPVNNGESSLEDSVQIETEIQDVRDIAEFVGRCLIESNLLFDTVQLLNMDDSRIDMENPKTEMKMIVKL